MKVNRRITGIAHTKVMIFNDLNLGNTSKIVAIKISRNVYNSHGILLFDATQRIVEQYWSELCTLQKLVDRFYVFTVKGCLYGMTLNTMHINAQLDGSRYVYYNVKILTKIGNVYKLKNNNRFLLQLYRRSTEFIGQLNTVDEVKVALMMVLSTITHKEYRIVNPLRSKRLLTNNDDVYPQVNHEQ